MALRAWDRKATLKFALFKKRIKRKDSCFRAVWNVKLALCFNLTNDFL